MNCKHCGHSLSVDAKFCNKCGKSVGISKPEVNTEKLKKSLKTTGNSVSAIGWLTIILNVAIFIWSMFDTSFSDSGFPVPDLTGTLIMVIISLVFIILGNRIKELVDRNIKLYLQILIGLSLLLLAFIFYTGGRAGLLFFLVMAYLISSLISVTKALKVEEYQSSLTSPKYMLNKNGWIIFSVVSIILLFLAFRFDISRSALGYEEDTNQNIATYFAEDDSWKPFTSSSGFSVLFPNHATAETENIAVPDTVYQMKMDTFTSEKSDGTTYLISVTAPIDVPDYKPVTNFDGTLNGMLASDPTNKLVSSAKTIFKGTGALDYLIYNSGSGYYLKGKIFLNDTDMVTLMVIYEAQYYNETEYNKFINSFEFN